MCTLCSVAPALIPRAKHPGNTRHRRTLVLPGLLFNSGSLPRSTPRQDTNSSGIFSCYNIRTSSFAVSVLHTPVEGKDCPAIVVHLNCAYTFSEEQHITTLHPTQPHKMPSQIASPIPIAPGRRLPHLMTSQDLFASINATLANKGSSPVTPKNAIQQHDYYVPAPPPPSPVSFRTDQWPTSTRKH